MIKYSFVVPCYNGENYIKRCLGSILEQDGNYEVIIINDGSLDNSLDLINEYVDNKKVFVINQKNMGLSVSRNNGISKSRGEYLIFVDIDDYIDKDFLTVVDKNIENEDMLKIGYNSIYKEEKEVHNNIVFSGNGKDAFNELIKSRIIFEMAPLYIIKRNYMIENNYFFEKDKYHEDFGLIPYMIINANSFKSIDYNGYMYVQTSNSITRCNNSELEYKKALDILYFFDKYKDSNNRMFLSYMANASINKLKYLDKEKRRLYKKELINRKIYKYLLSDNLFRKIKKMLAFINLDFVLYK